MSQREKPRVVLGECSGCKGARVQGCKGARVQVGVSGFKGAAGFKGGVSVVPCLVRRRTHKGDWHTCPGLLKWKAKKHVGGDEKFPIIYLRFLQVGTRVALPPGRTDLDDP